MTLSTNPSRGPLPKPMGEELQFFTLAILTQGIDTSTTPASMASSLWIAAQIQNLPNPTNTVTNTSVASFSLGCNHRQGWAQVSRQCDGLVYCLWMSVGQLINFSTLLIVDVTNLTAQIMIYNRSKYSSQTQTANVVFTIIQCVTPNYSDVQLYNVTTTTIQSHRLTISNYSTNNL